VAKRREAVAASTVESLIFSYEVPELLFEMKLAMPFLECQ